MMIGKPGSPNRRESHGDGASIVVRGWESQPHGEGRQVIRWPGREGMRDAERQHDPRHPRGITGELDAWKTCTSSSGRGGWKRTRSRLAVTAEANGQVNELRHKPSTSPAAYSTIPIGVLAPPSRHRSTARSSRTLPFCPG